MNQGFLSRILPRAGLASGVSWLLLLLFAYVGLESSGLLRGMPWTRVLQSLVVIPWALALLGAGGLVLGRWAPRTLEDDLGPLRALGVGLVLWGLLSLPVALAGGLNLPGACLLLLLMGSSWILKPPIRWPRLDPGRLPIEAALLPLALLCLLPALFDVYLPARDVDELYYHLALPRQLLELGSLVGGPWAPNGSRPLALHLPWASLMATGGESAPRLFHLLLTTGLLWGVHLRARRAFGIAAGLIAPFLLLGSASFLEGAGLARTDIPAALLVFLAFDAVVQGGRGALLLLSLTAGGAMAIKYTSAIVLLPLFALLPLLWGAGLREGSEQVSRPTIPRVLLAGLGSLALLLPWWFKNLAFGLHPLFPFAGWHTSAGTMLFQFPEKYGMGRELGSLLLLPWNVTMHADPGSAVFLGRVSPAFLAALPLALLAARRSSLMRACLVVSLLAGLLWALQVQWLRYLLPALPIAALMAGGALASRGRLIAALGGLLLLLGLPANLAPSLARATDGAASIFGRESREDFLERNVPSWGAIRWINEESPPSSLVALLFTWDAYLLERPFVLGSVEDHVPTRYLLAEHGDQALDFLASGGVTHVLTVERPFVRKSYSFLESSRFEAEFGQPQRRCQELLEQRARLVFEDGRFQVWELGDSGL